MNIAQRVFGRFRNVSEKQSLKMITETGNGFYSWNGKLYQSDIIRSCIRPKTKAIGKLVAKHILQSTDKDGNKQIKVNPKVYIRFLLEEPNEYMTGQMLQEKVANQLALNNNAFILIVRDAYMLPCKLYPIPATNVEAKVINNQMWLKFYFTNGKSDIYPYTEIIHLRDDFLDNNIFGESPAPALSELMNIVTTLDQGIIKAIKNSGLIRWLLKAVQSMRPEDLTKVANNFEESFLNITKGTSVAAVDTKVEAQQVEPNDKVPNAPLLDRQKERIYAFFNTNEKIVKSDFDEDEWLAYDESQVEPLAVQMSTEYTRKLFSRKERGFGNKIIFEASNLTYASMTTKLQLVQFVDRAIMTPNEVRECLNLAPIDGGDVALLRKDTGKITEGGEKD